MRNGGGFDQNDSPGGGAKWLDSGLMSKVEPIELTMAQI